MGNFHFELMLGLCEGIDIYSPPCVKYDTFSPPPPPLTFSGKLGRVLYINILTKYYKECKKEARAEAAYN